MAQSPYLPEPSLVSQIRDCGTGFFPCFHYGLANDAKPGGILLAFGDFDHYLSCAESRDSLHGKESD
jgi:hypothetical protein